MKSSKCSPSTYSQVPLSFSIPLVAAILIKRSEEVKKKTRSSRLLLYPRAVLLSFSFVVLAIGGWISLENISSRTVIPSSSSSFSDRIGKICFDPRFISRLGKRKEMEISANGKVRSEGISPRSTKLIPVVRNRCHSEIACWRRNRSLDPDCSLEANDDDRSTRENDSRRTNERTGQVLLEFVHCRMERGRRDESRWAEFERAVSARRSPWQSNDGSHLGYSMLKHSNFSFFSRRRHSLTHQSTRNLVDSDT